MKRAVFLLLIVAMSAFALLAQVQPSGQNAFEHVRYLASNAFKGRKAGTPEYRKAAEFVAEKMKEYGLKPAGENQSYFQEVTFKNWTNFEQPIRLEILKPEHRVYFAGSGRDFTPISGTGSGIARGQLAFVGFGISDTTEQWDDYQNLDVANKIVAILPNTPNWFNRSVRQRWNLTRKIKNAVAHGAKGLIVLNVQTGSRRYFRRFSLPKDACPENFVVIRANTAFLDDAFYLADRSWRFLTSETLRKKKSFTTELPVVVEMEAHFTQIDSLTAPNVLGLLPGRDRKLKNEYIIIGGHLDHIGVGVDGFINNGADDNAGSVAVLLELARVLKENHFRPKRTIVFAAWAGEELGLVGSRYYTEHPIFPLDKTVYLNMDMVACGDDDLYVGGMQEFSEFFKIASATLSPNLREKLHFRLNYRGSDHSAFLPKGVTAISLRTGNVLTNQLDDEHPEYHRPGDMPAIVNPRALETAARYYYQILTHLSTTEDNLFNPEFHQQFVHRDASVVDLHCDAIMRYVDGEDLTKDNKTGHIDIPKLKKGAVDLQVFACFSPAPENEKQKLQSAHHVLDLIDGVHRLVKQNPNDLALVKNFADFLRLRGTGKTGVLIGIEGGYAIEDDLSLLRTFYREGVRLMTLTHWTHTDWANGSADTVATLGGLSEFGEKVIKEMNKLGMIIDVSHVHDSTFWDVMRISKDPVIASHSSCRALAPHHRNLSDEMLKALAKNGGVIGINFYPGYLNSEYETRYNKLRARLAKKYGLSDNRSAAEQLDPKKQKRFREEFQSEKRRLVEELGIDVKLVVDHIEHVIKVTGSVDHVGLGSDFDGISITPIGLENAGKLSNITKELLARGYKESDIKKILGGNFLRVFRQVVGMGSEEGRSFFRF